MPALTFPDIPEFITGGRRQALEVCISVYNYIMTKQCDTCQALPRQLARKLHTEYALFVDHLEDIYLLFEEQYKFIREYDCSQSNVDIDPMYSDISHLVYCHQELQFTATQCTLNAKSLSIELLVEDFGWIRHGNMPFLERSNTSLCSQLETQLQKLNQFEMACEDFTYPENNNELKYLQQLLLILTASTANRIAAMRESLDCMKDTMIHPIAEIIEYTLN